MTNKHGMSVKSQQSCSILSSSSTYCTGFLSGDEWNTKWHTECTSPYLVWHRHI